MYLLFFRFTLILSSKYANISSPQATPSRQSSRKSFDKPINSPLFPTSCFVCKKERIQRKKKNEYPVTVHKLNVESTIKAAANEKNPTLYFEIKDADLIARELRYHKTSYKAFYLQVILNQLMNSLTLMKRLKNNKQATSNLFVNILFIMY